MKIMKKLLIIVPVAIVVLLIAAVILIGVFADRAVKMGIEKGGSKALPVSVSVGDVDVSIFGGKLALGDLKIGNPEGYKHENMLELKSGSVAVNIRSLLSSVVKINQITLDGAEVVLEQKDLMRNNIKDIISAIPKAPKTEEEVEGKKLHIDELIVSNTTVKVKLLSGPTIPLKLDTITLKDLGSDNKLSTPRLIGKILSALARGIAKQGAGILPDDLLKGISEAADKLLEAGEVIFKEGIEAGKKALEDAQDVTKKALEGAEDATKKMLEGGEGATEKVLENAGDAGKKVLEDAGDAGKKIGEGLKDINPFKKKKNE